MAYYSPQYNTSRNRVLLAKGQTVRALEDQYGEPEPVEVFRGTVEKFDNRKVSDGYTVIIRVGGPAGSGLVSFRPDELEVI